MLGRPKFIEGECLGEHEGAIVFDGSVPISQAGLLEEAPQGIGAAKPVRLPSSLTQFDSIQPKSILTQPKSRSRAGTVDLVSDSVNPCAICAVDDQQ